MKLTSWVAADRTHRTSKRMYFYQWLISRAPLAALIVATVEAQSASPSPMFQTFCYQSSMPYDPIDGGWKVDLRCPNGTTFLGVTKATAGVLDGACQNFWNSAIEKTCTPYIWEIGNLEFGLFQEDCLNRDVTLMLQSACPAVGQRTSCTFSALEELQDYCPQNWRDAKTIGVNFDCSYPQPYSKPSASSSPGAVSPAVMPTKSMTNTMTASQSYSATQSATRTSTGTSTATSTMSISQSSTRTQTPSSTPLTLSSTATGTATASSTASLTASPSQTATATSSATMTSTGTGSQSGTATASATASVTASSSPAPFTCCCSFYDLVQGSGMCDRREPLWTADEANGVYESLPPLGAPALTRFDSSTFGGPYTFRRVVVPNVVLGLVDTALLPAADTYLPYSIPGSHFGATGADAVVAVNVASTDVAFIAVAVRALPALAGGGNVTASTDVSLYPLYGPAVVSAFAECPRGGAGQLSTDGDLQPLSLSPPGPAFSSTGRPVANITRPGIGTFFLLIDAAGAAAVNQAVAVEVTFAHDSRFFMASAMPSPSPAARPRTRFPSSCSATAGVLIVPPPPPPPYLFFGVFELGPFLGIVIGGGVLVLGGVSFGTWYCCFRRRPDGRRGCVCVINAKSTSINVLPGQGLQHQPSIRPPPPIPQIQNPMVAAASVVAAEAAAPPPPPVQRQSSIMRISQRISQRLLGINIAEVGPPPGPPPAAAVAGPSSTELSVTVNNTHVTHVTENVTVLCTQCGQDLTRLAQLEAQNAALTAQVAALTAELERWRRTGGLGKGAGAGAGGRIAGRFAAPRRRRGPGAGGGSDDEDGDGDGDGGGGGGKAASEFAPRPVLGSAEGGKSRGLSARGAGGAAITIALLPAVAEHAASDGAGLTEAGVGASKRRLVRGTSARGAGASGSGGSGGSSRRILTVGQRNPMNQGDDSGSGSGSGSGSSASSRKLSSVAPVASSSAAADAATGGTGTASGGSTRRLRTSISSSSFPGATASSRLLAAVAAANAAAAAAEESSASASARNLGAASSSTSASSRLLARESAAPAPEPTSYDSTSTPYQPPGSASTRDVTAAIADAATIESSEASAAADAAGAGSSDAYYATAAAAAALSDAYAPLQSSP